MRKLKMVSGIAALLFSAGSSFAGTDTTISTAYPIGLYKQFLFPEKTLYTGRQYVDYRPVLDKGGHPYFQSPEFLEGSILYDGMLYENVPLQYDIVKNMVITWDPFKKYLLELVNDKVDWFTINDIRFVHLKQGTNTRYTLDDGFYRILYDGKTTVLKKEAKFINQDIDIKKVLRTIEETPVYYIKKNNAYYPVDKKASVLKVLADKKADLNQFIRKNDLDLSDDKEKALAAIAAQYDILTR
jgi:hypothetical protein